MRKLIKQICLLCLIVSSLFILIPSAQASEKKQCFFNAQLAYEYLLAQEKRQSKNVQNSSIQRNASRLKPSRININTASEAELVTLVGVGSKKAQAILLYRNTMGQFSSIDDLVKVHGIGKKTVEKNRTRLSVAD